MTTLRSASSLQNWFATPSLVISYKDGLPFFCSILKQFHDEQVYPDEAFAELADFNLRVGTARTRARQELLRATSSSHGATLFDGDDSGESTSQQTRGHTRALL